MSIFPGAVATSADLKIAVDNLATKLIAPMAVGDTVAAVQSTTGWVANMIATIGTEQLGVTSVSGGNILNVTRGFNGTAAAAHANGSAVSAFIDAYHHNALVNETVAIEQALGPNLGNVGNLSGPVTAFGGASGFITAGNTPPILQMKLSYPVNSTAYMEALLSQWPYGTFSVYLPQVIDGSQTWEGTCGVSGTTVTRITGAPFAAEMVGRVLLLDGSDACGGIVSVNTTAQTLQITNAQPTGTGLQWDVLGDSVFSIEWPSRANDTISSRFEFWYNGFLVGGNPMNDLTITTQFDANHNVGRSLNLGVTNTGNPLSGTSKLIQIKTTSGGASRVLIGRDSDVIDDGSSPVQIQAPSIKISGTTSTSNVDINGMSVYNGVGSPAGVVAANVGSIYINIAGGHSTTLWVKESATDATGWHAVQTI